MQLVKTPNAAEDPVYCAVGENTNWGGVDDEDSRNLIVEDNAFGQF